MRGLEEEIAASFETVESGGCTGWGFVSAILRGSRIDTLTALSGRDSACQSGGVTIVFVGSEQSHVGSLDDRLRW